MHTNLNIVINICCGIFHFRHVYSDQWLLSARIKKKKKKKNRGEWENRLVSDNEQFRFYVLMNSIMLEIVNSARPPTNDAHKHNQSTSYSGDFAIFVSFSQWSGYDNFSLFQNGNFQHCVSPAQYLKKKIIWFALVSGAQ